MPVVFGVVAEVFVFDDDVVTVFAVKAPVIVAVAPLRAPVAVTEPALVISFPPMLKSVFIVFNDGIPGTADRYR